MGRHNSKRRMPEGKEGWTHATGTWEAAIKRVRCDACGAPVTKTHFYDTHRWRETCAEPPDTAAPVAAGGDGAHAAPDADGDAEGIIAGVVDGNPSDDSRGDSDGEADAGARRRQLYNGADATLMEVALNLCEWKLKHNIKTAAFGRLSKLLKKHMLPKDGSELTKTWYQVEHCLNVPDIKKYIVHCCPCDEHRYGHSLDGD
eukprot:jgi/Tetstr1/439348/TSEL_027786.t1